MKFFVYLNLLNKKYFCILETIWVILINNVLHWPREWILSLLFFCEVTLIKMLRLLHFFTHHILTACHLLRINFSHHMALFHWQPTSINIIMDFGKISFKSQKSPYLHKKVSKLLVQNLWRYYLIKTHGSSSWHIISFLAHDPSSWVSLEEFWELWFGGPRSMFNKAPAIQLW